MKSTALASLLRSVSVVLLIVGSLASQFPCPSSYYPSQPAFFITCPCDSLGNTQSPYNVTIDMYGQGRIGTVQQIYTTSTRAA